MTSRALRQRIVPIFTSLDNQKLSCLLTQLLNQANAQQWSRFFSLLRSHTSFAHIPLDLKLHEPQLERLKQIQERFSPLRSLVVQNKQLSIATVIAVCTKLQGLFLREFTPATHDELRALSFPDTLLSFSMRLQALPATVSADMRACIQNLFSRCPHLIHLELEDAKDSKNLRRSIHTENWPSTLEHVRLSDWYITQEELRGLLTCCPRLRRLSVRYLRSEITASVMQALQFPPSFEGVEIADAKEKTVFLNKLRLYSVQLPYKVA